MEFNLVSKFDLCGNYFVFHSPFLHLIDSLVTHYLGFLSLPTFDSLLYNNPDPGPKLSVSAIR